MFEPLYKKERLVLGNPESQVAIVSLWTKAKELAKNVDPSKYAVMGQLFSAERGLDILVRNLLANPQITNIVITGVDFSKSGIVLRDFFERGFCSGATELTNKPCWRVKSDYLGYIDLDIPETLLNELRNSIKVDWIKDLSDFEPAKLAKPKGNRKKCVIPKKESDQKKQYLGEDTAYIVRGKTVAEAWLQILDTILKFGKVSGTHYDDEQKEILNLISVITDEDPNNLYIPEFMPFGKKHTEEYIPKVTTDFKERGTSYTYGSRMRSWFGQDQIKEAVEKLARETISRAVVINLWDSSKDLRIGGSPCINHIWLRFRDKKLHMTVTIRSNDMFEAYPDNAYALRSLQEIIRKDLLAKLKQKEANGEIKLGDLIINSQSAHIYRDCWESAEMIVKKYLEVAIVPPGERWDLRGNFVVNVSDGWIIVQHISPSNELLGTYKGKTARELRDILVKEDIIGNTAHAIYLGVELARAEQALKSRSKYNQDE